MPAERAFVTGAAGLVGARLVEKLSSERGMSIAAVIRNAQTAPRVARYGIDLRLSELTEAAVRDAARGCRLIFHCAHDDLSADGGEANLQAAQAVAAAAGAERARVVYLSSAAVYGPGFFGQKPAELSEDAPDKPSADKSHATSKLEVQRLLQAESTRAGFELVILHPTLIYGPYSRPWVIEPLAQLKKSWLVLPESGQGSANLVFIDDVVDAMIAAATTPSAAGERFLISGPAPVSWAQFYERYQHMLGKDALLYAATAGELKQLKATINRRAAKDLVKALSDQSVLLKAERIPAVDEAFHLARQRLPGLWAKLKGSRDGAPPPPPAPKVDNAPKPDTALPPLADEIHFPNARHMALYRSKVTVSSAKAGRVLGYRPRFDFASGMAVVEAYARWANLL